MRIQDLPLMLRVEQFAELADISPWATYEAVKRGQVPAVRLGRSIRIPRTALAEMIGESDA